MRHAKLLFPFLCFLLDSCYMWCCCLRRSFECLSMVCRQLLWAALPGICSSAAQQNTGVPTFPSAKCAWLVGCDQSSSRQQTSWATLVVASGTIADTYLFMLSCSNCALLMWCPYVITQIVPSILPYPARCSECLFCPSRVCSRQKTAKTSVITLWVTVWSEDFGLVKALLEIFESCNWGLQRPTRILP